MPRLPDIGQCEAWDLVFANDEDEQGKYVRCTRTGARVLERGACNFLRTRIICRDHGFEPDLFSPEPGGPRGVAVFWDELNDLEAHT